MDTNTLICHECGHRHKHYGKRGLCYGCYQDASIREKYPKRQRSSMPRPRRRDEIEAAAEVDDDPRADMTMAEVEAMIAEQLPTMPKEPKYPHLENRLPVAVVRGRGMQARARREPM